MHRIAKAYKAVPSRLRHKIRKSRIRKLMIARHLASTSKRLDLCSAQIAHALHLSGLSDKFPVQGKVCLEVGSGRVLSHALVFYLMGAKKVIATDISRLAFPSTLYRSIHCSVRSFVREILSPFEDHSMIRDRLNKLLRVKAFSFDVLEKLGIEYVAPIDLTSNPPDLEIDFAFSRNVLEHVPTDEILPLLNNLSISLTKKGKMIHCIGLEDHQDIENNPFGFLGDAGEKFTKDLQITRGNRIRRSQWKNTLSQVRNMEFRFIYEWSRRDKMLPSIIDPSIQYIDEKDLTITNIGVLGIKT